MRRELDWVDAVGDWESGDLKVERVRDAGHPGTITVYRPDIGGLLPVYVHDRYEGFEVKTFPELTDAELDRYLDANVAAVAATWSLRPASPTRRSPTT